MRSKGKRPSPPAVAVAAAGAAAAGIAITMMRRAASDPVPALASTLDLAALGDRILVIAPHPDDEVASTGGLIAQALASGACVRVVLLTVGDGYRRAARRLAGGQAFSPDFVALGEVRAAESRAALEILGVPAEGRTYLAYPDGCLSHLWDTGWSAGAVRAGATGEEAVPYGFAHRPGAANCGESLARDLADIVADFQPTAVVHPDAADTHADHRAASTFCDYALRQKGYRGVRLTYLMHHRVYPFPWAYRPSAFLRPPSGLARACGPWYSLPLPAEVAARKVEALRAFASQMRIPDMRAYLLSFARRNELFIGQSD